LNSIQSPSTFTIWFEAARPKTLAAAFVPIMVAAGLAYANDTLLYFPTFVALICALLIQIGTNFANDYYDFIKGSDTDERVGFIRATSKGLVTPKSMKNAAFLTMLAAFIIGLYLVWHGGLVILAIGLLSILFGILYTAGPFPLGYNGLGDVFVFIFFGIAAVMGTYYVNAFEWTAQGFFAALSVGALCVNILVVNNLRDIQTDVKSGKRTIGVLFGEKALKLEYVFMLLLAYAIPPHFLVQEGYNYWILLPFILIPFAVKLCLTIFKHTEKAALNATLESTARFMFLFGLLFTIGLVIG